MKKYRIKRVVDREILKIHFYIETNLSQRIPPLLGNSAIKVYIEIKHVIEHHSPDYSISNITPSFIVFTIIKISSIPFTLALNNNYSIIIVRLKGFLIQRQTPLQLMYALMYIKKFVKEQ